MSVEFLIPFKNSWYVHPFAFMCKSKKFDIVAECEKGPIVIQFKNILATQFEIDPKYPETSIPLRNFIIYHLRMIKTDNKSSEGLILTYYNPKSDLDLYHDIPNHSKSVRQFKRTFKLFDEKEEKRSKYTHAGMAMKGHGNSFIVEQNAVNDKAFKMKKKTSPEREKVEKNSEKSKKTRLFSHYTTKNTEKNHFFDDNEKNYHMLQDLGIEKFMKTENMENVFKKSDVRSLLHPNINKELFTNEDLWVLIDLYRMDFTIL